MKHVLILVLIVGCTHVQQPSIDMVKLDDCTKVIRGLEKRYEQPVQAVEPHFGVYKTGFFQAPNLSKTLFASSGVSLLGPGATSGGPTFDPIIVPTNSCVILDGSATCGTSGAHRWTWDGTDVKLMAGGSTFLACNNSTGVCTDNFGFATSSAFALTGSSAAPTIGIHQRTAAVLSISVSGVDRWEIDANGELYNPVAASNIGDITIPMNILTGKGAQILMGTAATGSQSSYSQVSGTAFIDTTARNPAACTGSTDFAGAYTLPANALSANGKGVRFHFEGTTANNANAKGLQIAFGSQVIVTKTLGVSVAGTWEVEGECYRSGSSAQKCSARAWNHGTVAGTVSGTDGASVLLQDATLSGTQTDTSGILIRIQTPAGGCTATSDVTQTMARVSFDN